MSVSNINDFESMWTQKYKKKFLIYDPKYKEFVAERTIEDINKITKGDLASANNETLLFLYHLITRYVDVDKIRVEFFMNLLETPGQGSENSLDIDFRVFNPFPFFKTEFKKFQELEMKFLKSHSPINMMLYNSMKYSVINRTGALTSFFDIKSYNVNSKKVTIFMEKHNNYNYPDVISWRDYEADFIQPSLYLEDPEDIKKYANVKETFKQIDDPLKYRLNLKTQYVIVFDTDPPFILLKLRQDSRKNFELWENYLDDYSKLYRSFLFFLKLKNLSSYKPEIDINSQKIDPVSLLTVRYFQELQITAFYYASKVFRANTPDNSNLNLKFNLYENVWPSVRIMWAPPIFPSISEKNVENVYEVNKGFLNDTIFFYRKQFPNLLQYLTDFSDEDYFSYSKFSLFLKIEKDHRSPVHYFLEKKYGNLKNIEFTEVKTKFPKRKESFYFVERKEPLEVVKDFNETLVLLGVMRGVIENDVDFINTLLGSNPLNIVHFPGQEEENLKIDILEDWHDEKNIFGQILMHIREEHLVDSKLLFLYFNTARDFFIFKKVERKFDLGKITFEKEIRSILPYIKEFDPDKNMRGYLIKLKPQFITGNILKILKNQNKDKNTQDIIEKSWNYIKSEDVALIELKKGFFETLEEWIYQ